MLVGILLVSVAVFAAGWGHGTYLAARLLFPFTMFSTFLCGSITPPFVVVGLAQFPGYGLLSGISYRSHHLRACLVVIATVHLLGVALNFVAPAGDFPNVVRQPNHPASGSAEIRTRMAGQQSLGVPEPERSPNA